MIEKERLEELIKQGATIWTDEYIGSHFKIKLTKHFVAKLGDSFDLYGYGCNYFGVPLNHLFETKEEAEWYKKFGCIERTERLELPTWEEFKANRLKNDFYGVNFIAKASGCYYVLYISDNTKKIRLYDAACFEEVFSGEPNEENYTLACRKAKELFLGKNAQ